MQTKIVSADNLSSMQLKRMFQLMSRYYEAVSEDIFIKDLLNKQKVILLFGPDNQIEGFSTLTQENLEANGKRFVAIFSGDTVLSEAYWGNGALAMAFGKYLFQTKMRYLFRDVNWFLISKGYKTYLLMTNNFPQHFPRFDLETPKKIQSKMDVFYTKRFGDKYIPEQGLIRLDFSENYHLKTCVAEISEQLRSNPKISFFEKKNPNWQIGVELACVAKVSLWIPVRYIIKRVYKYINFFTKTFFKNEFVNKKTGESNAIHQSQ